MARVSASPLPRQWEAQTRAALRAEQPRESIPQGSLPDDELGVLEAPPDLAKPPLYRVIMLNDDFTPMEFALHILKTVFRLEDTQATEILLAVHTRGSAVCGAYPRDIAETRMLMANEYSRRRQHPLRCIMERKN